MFAHSGIQNNLRPTDLHSRAQTQFEISCERLVRKVKSQVSSFNYTGGLKVRYRTWG
jgi:hypothetical protein